MKLDRQEHIDFYKHVSALSFATFAGCITLMGVFNLFRMPLVLAAYMALAAAVTSLYCIRVIISEGRIPYVEPGRLFGRLSKYAPYRALIISLGIIATLISLSINIDK